MSVKTERKRQRERDRKRERDRERERKRNRETERPAVHLAGECFALLFRRLVVPVSRGRGGSGATGGEARQPALYATLQSTSVGARRPRRAHGTLRPREERRSVVIILRGRGLRRGHGAGRPSHGIGVLQQAEVNGGLKAEGSRRRK